MTSQPWDKTTTSDLKHDPDKLPSPTWSNSNTGSAGDCSLPSSHSFELWDIMYPIEVDYEALLDDDGEWDPRSGDPFLRGWEWAHPSEELVRFGA